MNFWLLTSEFPPAFGGGISTYCSETVRMLVSFGYKVTVITQDHSIVNTDFTKKEGYTLYRFNPSKYFTSSFLGYEAHLSYSFAQVLKELISTEGAPAIIESQEYMGIAYYTLQYKHLGYPLFKDLKILITLHAPSFLYLDYNKVPNYQLPYYWIGEMERFCIRSADMLISPSQYLVNELKGRMKTDDLDIHILKNPYKTAEEYTTPDVKENELVFFGKLIPQKGCLELISYFKELWQEGFEHSLTMIGGGNHLYHPEGIDMLDYIKRICQKEITEGKLKLLGAIKPEKLSQVISSAHIILIPSIVDNLPYTVPEVMSLGKIVLASKQGGQSEIITHGKDGFLFDHKEKHSFKEQLKNILALPPMQMEAISKNAFQKIHNEFSYKGIFEKKSALLNQMLLTDPKEEKKFPYIRPMPSPRQSNITTKKKELLSVVIPYYNMGKYVEECVESVIGSTYKNIEIILVNDGSKGSENLNILPTLISKYKIKVVNKENEGLALARNTGATVANGEFLAFLDPDDTIEATYYEKAIKAIKQYSNVYFVGCWAKYFDGATGFWPSFNPEPPYLLIHNMINSSAMVYKTSAFIESGLNDRQMIYGMEDYESVISMTEKGYMGVVLPEPLWNYRVRKDSMARAFTKNKQLYLYRLITEKHSAFYSIFASEVTNLLNANGPGFNYDNPTFFYNIPGHNPDNKFLNMAFRMIKRNKALRKLAIRIKNRLQ